MAMHFSCWSCGIGLEDEPMPLGRESRCRACVSDLHVCRLCNFHDTSKAKGCAEPVADEVRDKERANFCGYFSLNINAHDENKQAEHARDELAAMFGLHDGTGESRAPAPPADAQALKQQRESEADAAKDALNKLFGVDNDCSC